MSDPVTLRRLAAGELSILAQWGDEPEVAGHLGQPFATPRALARVRRQLSTGRRLGMLIILADGPPIGYIELAQLNWRARRGELCVFIGHEQHRGLGYGTAAVRQFTALLFGRHGLDRVYLRVAQSNTRARRCYRKCGFRPRGYLAPTPRQPERREALVLMELNRRDWLNRRPGGGGRRRRESR